MSRYVWVIQGAPEALKVYRYKKDAVEYLKSIGYCHRGMGIWTNKMNGKYDVTEWDMYLQKEKVR